MKLAKWFRHYGNMTGLKKLIAVGPITYLIATYKYDAFGGITAQTGTVVSPYKVFWEI